MKSICTSISFCLLILACKQAPETSKEVTPEPIIGKAAKLRLDVSLKKLVDSGNIGGVSALIFEKGEEVYYNSFGFMDKEAQKPMDRNTIVQIYSMTKPITGTALMTLYDQGKFQLDDPLEKYAPEFANMKVYVGEDANGKPILEDSKRPITIRDITRHTAGFGRNTEIRGLGKLIAAADALNRENTLTQMAGKMGKTPLYFHPGER